MNKQHLYIFVLALIAAFVVGCAQQAQTGQQATGAQDGNTQTTQDRTTTVPPEDQDQSSQTQDDARQELEGLFVRATKEYKVIYNSTSNYTGETTNAVVGMFVKDGQTRTDFTGVQEGQNVEARSFYTDAGLITCLNQEEEWNCMRLPLAENETTDNVASEVEDIQENLAEYAIERLPDRTIAGVRTSCYVLTTTDEDGTVIREELCVSAEGVPLFIEINSGDSTSRMVAQEYGTSVGASDFVPPAEPQDLSGMIPSQ